MKLIVAVIQAKDADALSRGLTARGFQSTRIDSTGGFLREQNVTMLVGIDDPHASEVLRVIRQTCRSRTRFVNPLMPIVEPVEFYVADPIEVEVGGATVFVLDVERYERIA